MYKIKSAINDGVKTNNILLSTKSCAKFSKVVYCSDHQSSNPPSLMSTIDKHLSERNSDNKTTVRQEVDKITISNNIKAIIIKIKESKYINTQLKNVQNVNGGKNTELIVKNDDLSDSEIDFSDVLIKCDKTVDLQREISDSKNKSKRSDDFKVIEKQKESFNDLNPSQISQILPCAFDNSGLIRQRFKKPSNCCSSLGIVMSKNFEYEKMDLFEMKPCNETINKNIKTFKFDKPSPDEVVSKRLNKK